MFHLKTIPLNALAWQLFREKQVLRNNYSVVGGGFFFLIFQNQVSRNYYSVKCTCVTTIPLEQDLRNNYSVVGVDLFYFLAIFLF